MQAFGKLLEKRVQKSKAIIFDINTVKKTVEMVILEMFGKVGLADVEIFLANEKNVILNCFRSIWYSELTLKKKFILNEINKKLGGSVVEQVRVNARS